MNLFVHIITKLSTLSTWLFFGGLLKGDGLNSLNYVSPDRGGDLLFLPRLSVRQSVRPSRILIRSNLKTFQDIFMKLRRNIKHHQTTCRTQEL